VYSLYVLNRIRIRSKFNINVSFVWLYNYKVTCHTQREKEKSLIEETSLCEQRKESDEEDTRFVVSALFCAKLCVAHKQL